MLTNLPKQFRPHHTKEMGIVSSIFSAKLRSWRQDPIQCVQDLFQTEPDAWQKKALLAFISEDPTTFRIALQACAGPGKSAVLAWCGWLFLLLFGEPGNHPKGAAVSISALNLKDNLWAELSKWQDRSELLKELFQWTHTRIYAKDHESTWFLSARAFSNSANAEEIGRTLSGLHSKYVLYLIDESGDIPPTIIKSAEQGLSTGPKFGKILMAGNPTSHDGMLYQAATKQRESWYIIKITGDPEDALRSPRISIEWARDQIKKFGRNDPWVMAYILGEFPESSINTLLSLSDVEKAVRRQIHETMYSFSQKRLGVDVARFGVDSTIIFPRQGLRAFKPVEMRGAKTDEIAARIMLSKNKWQSDLEFIDDTGGFGSGVIDFLSQSGISPHAVNFSSKAMDPKYYNKRAEMWFNMADWIKRGGCIPDDPMLIKELVVPTYSFKNGMFLIESKEQIKKRLNHSTDRSDALALTFAIPDQPKNTIFTDAIAKQKFKSEYDPFKTND